MAPRVGRRAVAALAGLAALAAGRIHHLEIKNDPRRAFLIESFGFLDGGTLDLDIHGVAVTPPPSADVSHVMGFVVVPVATGNDAAEYADDLAGADSACPLAEGSQPEGSLVIDISKEKDWKDLVEPAVVKGNSLFALIFVHCAPKQSGTSVTTTFTLDATFVNYKNGAPNYLSAGEMDLPWLYGAFAVAFAVALAVWAWYTRRHAADVARIHHGMTLLLALKTLSLVFEAVMYHYINVTGHTTAWNSMFYLFSAFKGFVMVAVSMLVASGWSVMRPFLTEREKKVLLVALVLQLLANTAIIMTDELAPGSIQYTAWLWLMHIADVAAAAAVIVPVTWSMRALEASALAAREGDGAAKAAETLNRLSRFRNFYLYTVSYLYVTRFFVWVLSGVVGYADGWVPPAFDELCTLAYYLYTGYRFRPAGENAYLRVSQDDDERPGGDVELGRATGAGAGGGGGGGGGAMQTIAATARTAEGGAAVAAEVAARGSAASAGAPAPAGAGAGGARAPGGSLARHVIAEEDDEFGLDDAGGAAPAGAGGKGGKPRGADEDEDLDAELDAAAGEDTPLRQEAAASKSSAGGLKQVKKASS